MKIKSVLVALSIGLFVIGCGPKDADIQKDILSKMGSMPQMQVSVKDGVATITGACMDENSKQKCEEIAKGIKGVKSVVNNCVVQAPPPPPAPMTVEINTDQVLSTAIASTLKAYSGASATVANGVVTLNGTVKRADLVGLMQSVLALKPKKVENKLIIK